MIAFTDNPDFLLDKNCPLNDFLDNFLLHIGKVKETLITYSETMLRGCLLALDEAGNLTSWEQKFIGDMVDRLAADELAQKPFECIFTGAEIKKILEVYDARCC